MNKLYYDLIQNIPDYETFLTPDELDQSTLDLVAKYPESASCFVMGKTRQGKDLLCLKIGNGSKNALMFGCPHPNEPIGTLLLEYFSEELAKDKDLRDHFDYTWYIVKAWDRDGLDLNSGWLKGPFSIGNYSRHFFRPAGYQQVEWTFPVDYKQLSFHRVLPETQAMMDLIDEIKPEFIYSLHNCGFGGAYWYISHRLPEDSFSALRQAANKRAVPLHKGEPELPYLVPLSETVYPSLSITDDYDYLEKYSEKNAKDLIETGNSSAAYARKYNSLTLLTELPYFYDARIEDLSPSDISRKEAILYMLDEGEKNNDFARQILDQTQGLVAEDCQIRMALEYFSRGSFNESTRRMVEEEEYQRPATQAEVLDNVYLTPFYSSITYALAGRMCERALAAWQDKKGNPTYNQSEVALAIEKLESLVKECFDKHASASLKAESQLDYTVVPIKDLVSIQLECGLIVIDALSQGLAEPI